ncbi:MAG: hypothetical protein FWD61_16165 [Phycisphaerales bacterium]|nr:hypothetical protein [Phycisphaerales bacterium]
MNLKQALSKALESADDGMLAEIIEAKRLYLDAPEHADPELMWLTLKLILQLDPIDKESPEESLDKLEKEDAFDIAAIFQSMRELQE